MNARMRTKRKKKRNNPMKNKKRKPKLKKLPRLIPTKRIVKRKRTLFSHQLFQLKKRKTCLRSLEPRRTKMMVQ